MKSFEIRSAINLEAKMILKPINSSLIESIGYDAAAEALHVKFKGGKHYVYFDATQALYDDFAKAESPGRFFAANVRSRFRHSIVDASAGGDAVTRSEGDSGKRESVNH